MRITVDIDAGMLSEIQQEVGIMKKSPAIAKVLQDYLREARKKKIISRVMEGKTDYGCTNEELEGKGRHF